MLETCFIVKLFVTSSYSPIILKLTTRWFSSLIVIERMLSLMQENQRVGFDHLSCMCQVQGSILMTKIWRVTITGCCFGGQGHQVFNTDILYIQHPNTTPLDCLLTSLPFTVNSFLKTSSQSSVLVAFLWALVIPFLFFYIPCMKNHLLCPSPALTSLSKILSISFHVAVKYMISSFLIAKQYSIVNIFFIFN